mmetsp:Transcript_59759/g.177088  ORF Transcript_59759/g.177088 Transcript_59759/m.177088 type:complete len:369 (-) Transcript_59759:130-1236(-)
MRAVGILPLRRAASRIPLDTSALLVRSLSAASAVALCRPLTTERGASDSMARSSAVLPPSSSAVSVDRPSPGNDDRNSDSPSSDRHRTTQERRFILLRPRRRSSSPVVSIGGGAAAAVAVVVVAPPPALLRRDESSSGGRIISPANSSTAAIRGVRPRSSLPSARDGSYSSRRRTIAVDGDADVTATWRGVVSPRKDGGIDSDDDCWSRREEGDGWERCRTASRMSSGGRREHRKRSRLVVASSSSDEEPCLIPPPCRLMSSTTERGEGGDGEEEEEREAWMRTRTSSQRSASISSLVVHSSAGGRSAWTATSLSSSSARCSCGGIRSNSISRAAYTTPMALSVRVGIVEEDSGAPEAKERGMAAAGS